MLLNNQSPRGVVFKCVAEHPSALEECAFPKIETHTVQLQKRVAEAGGHPVIDMTPWICPTETCLPVIGGVLVYRHGSHITDTYVRTLSPMLEVEIRRVLDEIDVDAE